MDGYITIGTKLDTASFDKEIAYVEAQMNDIQDKLIRVDVEGEEVGDVAKLEAQYEKLSKKLGQLNTKQKELNNADVKKLEQSIGDVSKKTSSVIASVGKWALAIFSVRSAYGAVTSAMSTLSQYDQGLKADLEYMRFAVAVALKPVIEAIVNLAYRLLSIVRSVGIALFNFDIFSEATAKNFQKINGNAQKLKKTITGFDEMNIINSAGTGGGGGILPTGKIEIDEGIVEKIGAIKQAYLDMGTALENSDMFRSAFGAWGTFVEGVTRIVYGLFETIDGLMTLIVGIFTGDTEKMKEGLRLTIEGMLNMILGFGQVIVGLLQGLIYEIGSAIVNVTNAIGEIWAWIVSTILFGIQSIVGFFNTYLIQPIKTTLEKIGEVVGGAIADVIIGVKNTFRPIANWMNKYVINPIRSFFGNLWTALKSGPKGFINYIIQSFESAINWVGQKFTDMFNKISFTIPEWIPKIGGQKWGLNLTYKPVKLPRLAKGTILNNPGQGVLVGGRAIAGEAGREAYLPLSDTQLLEELGSTIGRYITINANITNTMNGRVISRELKRINASDNFAMNK